MPEAAMDKDDCTASWHHDIRLTWQICAMKREAAPEAVQGGTHDPFWHRVLALDRLHARAALSRGQLVGHGLRRGILGRLAESDSAVQRTALILIHRGQNVLVHPADDRNAHAVSEAEQ